MNLLRIFFAFLLFYVSHAVYNSSSYIDRPCGQDLTNLWLDVVVVVDNSYGMTNEGITEVSANIFTLFDSSRIGTDPNEPRTTRIGLVTYNYNTTVVADLNAIQSIDDLANVLFGDEMDKKSKSKLSYLSNGLYTAGDLLQRQSFKTNRDHYRKVILVYASTYSVYGDPVAVAKQLKDSGIIIITVAFEQSDDGQLDNLKNVASPDYGFTSKDVKLDARVRNALTQANCFCQNSWTQYRESYQNQSSSSFGTCIQPIRNPVVWNSAKQNCHKLNAFLASEFNQNKHDFIYYAALNTIGFVQPISYHIGLNFNSGTWFWDQPDGTHQVKVQEWVDWNQGYPRTPSSMSAGLNFQKGFGSYWQNVGSATMAANYICEVYACDTDNYCSG